MFGGERDDCIRPSPSSLTTTAAVTCFVTLAARKASSGLSRGLVPRNYSDSSRAMRPQRPVVPKADRARPTECRFAWKAAALPEAVLNTERITAG
jgi:hypothetical protein